MNLNFVNHQIEIDNYLPEGWSWAELKDIVLVPRTDIVDGPFGSDLKASEYADKGFPIIRIQNVDRNAFVNKNIRFVKEQKAAELKRHHFKSGDIVITKLGDPLGKACLVPEGFGPGVIVADVVRVRINHPYGFKPYLIYAINSGAVIDQLSEHVKGTTRPRVNLGNIRSLKIPIAPLEEQKRIALKMGELFDQLKIIRERLSKISEILKRFRQSVLAAACSGRLTADWRGKNSIKEKIEDILIKVREKRMQHAKSLSNKQKIMAIFSFQEEGDSDLLPKTWRFVALNTTALNFLVDKTKGIGYDGLE